MRHGDPSIGLGTLFSTLTAMASPGHRALTGKPLYENVPGLGFWPRTVGPLRRIARTLTNWHERSRQRRRLLNLSDHLLRDIGLTCHEVEIEWRKPFWKA